MSNIDFPYLVADIGGTNARFALVHSSLQLSDSHTFPTADYANVSQAIQAYLRLVNVTVRQAAIAIANPVLGDHVQMTNHHWQFSIQALQAQLSLDKLLVINDFTAQALAVTAMDAQQMVQIGGQPPIANAAKAVIGPGTGLGVSGLIPDGRGRMSALAGEGGHVAFAPRDAVERRLLAFAEAQFGGHVSAERMLCGAGLTLLYQFFAAEAGQGSTTDKAAKTPAEITRAALEGSDALCRTVLSRYCQILGDACANIALTLGATGGVYIAGGIVPRLLDFLPQSGFRARFEDKGRFAAYLAPVPVFVITHPQAGLLGAAVALRNE